MKQLFTSLLLITVVGLGSLLVEKAAAQGREPDSAAVPSQRVDSLEGLEERAAADSLQDRETAGDSLEVTDEALEAVARAFVAVQQVRRSFQARQGVEADTGQDGGSFHDRFRSQVRAVIEEQGLSVGAYRRVVRAARADPALRLRLLRRVRQLE